LTLASASPRRRELLGFLGVPFQAIGTDGEERDSPVPQAITVALPPAPLPLATHPTLLAWRKAHAACAETPESVIIGADTIVVLDGRLAVNHDIIGPGGYSHFPAGEPMLHGPAGDGGCRFVTLFDGPYDVEPLNVEAEASLGGAIVVDRLGSVPTEPTKMDLYDRAIGVRLLYEDPATGVEHDLIRYPAGLGARVHRHTAAHTIVVLEGRLQANDRIVGPGAYCHFPAGEPMFHAPAGDDDCLFVIVFHGPYDVETLDR